MAHPRARVDLVDVDRRALEVPRGAAREPVGVSPAVVAFVDDAGGGRRPQLEGAAVGVALHEHQPAVAVAQLELVERARGEPRNEQLPHAASAAHVERVRAPVPAVEIADDRDPLRVRGPHGEADARDASERHRHGAQHAPRLEEPALVEQVQVEVADRRREAVRVDELDPAAVGLGHQSVRRRRRGVEPGRKQVGLAVARERQVAVVHPQPEPGRRRPEGAVDETGTVAVQPEVGARIVQARIEKPLARTASGRRGNLGVHHRIIVSAYGPGSPERRAETRRWS